MITLDCETKSYADLKKVGAWAYAAHQTTEVICVCYGIESNPIQTWWPGKELLGVQAWPPLLKGTETYTQRHKHMPYDLYNAIVAGMPVEAHNVAFEYSIWINILEPEYRWAIPNDHQWRDTMAVAAYYALPMALDRLARVLGLGAKDTAGTRLISKYSKLHLKTAKEEIPEEDFESFVNYCIEDVKLEQDVSDFLGDLPEQELEVFHLDQEINQRGLYLNRKSIEDAIVIVQKRAKELADEFKAITGVNPSQNEKARQWFISQGAELENLQGDYIEQVLEGRYDVEVEGEARRALEIRRQYNRASTKKLEAMLRNRDRVDGRARYQTRYHGAATGRWTGTGFQPLNMSKGFEHVPPQQLLDDISHRSPEWLDIMYGDAMEAVGKATRHHICAEPGNRIIAGDLVSIEAVLLACLAGEEWKVEAFRNKEPIYELMGCEIHGLGDEAIELARRDKAAFKQRYGPERFDGKTGELAFGYQGALGAWRKFDPETTSQHSDDRVIEICRAWRKKHTAIVQFWRDLERAAVRCVHKGVTTSVRNTIGFERVDQWLSMILPNGKRIWYWDPQLRMTMPRWHNVEENEDCRAGTCDCEPRHQLTYMAQKEGQWKRVSTYGGKLAENATQATSREILVPAMLRLKDAGYKIILSVYDEIVSEMPNGQGSVEEFSEIMLESAGEWADHYPISVDVWEAQEYRK